MIDGRGNRSMFLMRLGALGALAGCSGGVSGMPSLGVGATKTNNKSGLRFIRSGGSGAYYDANGNWLMTVTSRDAYTYQLDFASRPTMIVDTRTFNRTGSTTVPTVGTFSVAGQGVVNGPDGGNASIVGTTLTYTDRYGNSDSGTLGGGTARGGSPGRQVQSWACALDIVDLIFAYVAFVAGCLTAETGIGIAGVFMGMYGMARAGEAAGHEC